MGLRRLAHRSGRATDLIVEERERGLYVLLDAAGVVVDRNRNAQRISERAATMIKSLGEDRMAGRLVVTRSTRVVLLPTAAIQLAAVQHTVARSGVIVPAELGWDLDMLVGATLIGGAAEPMDSQGAILAAVASSCPPNANSQATLDAIAEIVRTVGATHHFVGSTKELRSLILSA